MEKDPVCGGTIDEKKALKIQFGGKTYFFCGPMCKWAFEAAPDRFLSGTREKPPTTR